MLKSKKYWRLIMLALGGYVIVMFSIQMYKRIKMVTAYPPTLHGRLLVSTEEQLIVLHPMKHNQQIFNVQDLHVGEAHWNPSLNYIAFVTNANRDVLNLLEVSSGVIEPVNIHKKNSNYKIKTFSWSPSGDAIAYVIEEDFQDNVYIHTLENTSDRVVWECIHKCGTLLWSSDAEYLIFPEIESQTQIPNSYTKIISLTLTTKESSLSFSVPGIFERMSCRSDWTKCALLDYSQGLFISDHEGNLEKLFDAVGSIVWSPDNQWLAYTIIDDGVYSIPTSVKVYDMVKEESFQLYPPPTVFGGWLLPANEKRNYVFDWKE